MVPDIFNLSTNACKYPCMSQIPRSKPALGPLLRGNKEIRRVRCKSMISGDCPECVEFCVDKDSALLYSSINQIKRQMR